MTPPLSVKQYWNQVINSVRQCAESGLADLSGVTDKISDTINSLEDFYENCPLKVAIVSLCSLDNEMQDQIAQWLGTDVKSISEMRDVIINIPNLKKPSQLHCNFYLLENLPIKPLGDIGASIVVVVCHPDMNDDRIFEKLVGFASCAKVMFLIDPSQDSQLPELLKSIDWHVRKLSGDELLSKNLADNFKNENLIILLKNLTIMSILNELAQALVCQLESKLEKPKARRIKLQNTLDEHKRKFSFEEIANLHKEMKLNLEEFLRRQNKFLYDHLKPPYGQQWKKINEYIDKKYFSSIASLEKQKNYGKVYYLLPSRSRYELMEEMKNSFLFVFRQSIESTFDFLENANGKYKKVIKENYNIENAVSLRLENALLDEEIESLLRKITFEKTEYAIEEPKYNFWQGIFKYRTFIFLLFPMISLYSIITDNSQIIRIVFAIASFGAIVVGAFMSIYVDIPNDRKNYFEKSLNQEKEHLVKDCIRHFESLPDAWHRSLAEFARQQREQLSGQVDRLLDDVRKEAARRQKTYETNISAVQAEELALQRAIQSQSALVKNIKRELNQCYRLLTESLDRVKP